MAVFRCFLRVLKVACFAFMLCISSAFAVVPTLHPNGCFDSVEVACGDNPNTCIATPDANDNPRIFLGWSSSPSDTTSYFSDVTDNNNVYSDAYAICTTGTFAVGVRVSSSSKNVFRFSLSAKGNFTVDYGDGTVRTINRSDTTATEYSHTYSAIGNYIVKFSGVATEYNSSTVGDGYNYFMSGSYNWDLSHSAISFYTRGDVGYSDGAVVYGVYGSLGSMFPTLGDTTGLASDSATLLRIQPRFAETFRQTNVASVPDNLFGDVTGQAADNMFTNSFLNSRLERIPENLFSGITGAAKGLFGATFRMCNFSSIPSGLFSGVTGAADYMFAETFSSSSYSLTTLPSGLFAGVSGAAAAMFKETFGRCIGLTSIPSNLFSGVSGAADSMFFGTFKGCSNLTTVPSNLFSGVSGAEAAMFEETFASSDNNSLNCGLTSIPSNLFSGVSGAADSMFSRTFRGCKDLTQITQVGSTGLFAGVTSANSYIFSGTFRNCSSLTSIPSNMFANSIPIPYGATGAFGSMFENTGITAIPAGLFDGVDDSDGGHSAFSATFAGCTHLISIPENLFLGIRGAGYNQFYRTFYGCTSLTALPNSLFPNLSSIKSHYSFKEMFSGDTNLSGYVPAGFFGNLSDYGYDTAMDDIFLGTNLDTSCPDGYEPVSTNFQVDWSINSNGDKAVMCKVTDSVRCGAGYYLANKYVSGTGFVPTCMQCAMGYYCSSFAQYYTLENNGLTPCPAGTYNNTYGATSVDACVPCAAGKYCPQGQSYVPSDCQNGYYCPAASAPVRCPAGTWSAIGAQSVEDCSLECAAGYYCDETGKHACPVRKWSDDGAASVDDCYACPAGYQCNGSGSKTNCPVKKYCPEGELAVSCPAGTYNDTTGAQSADDCKTCLEGSYCPENGINENGVTSAYGYFYCPSRKWSDAGATSSSDCYACPAGYYCNSASKTECPAGRYCPASSASLSDSSYCSAGTWSDDGARSQDDCYACPAGYVCQYGAKTLCLAGKYCSEDDTSVYGQYCSAGTWSDAGTVSEDDCYACPAGHYCTGNGSKYECPEGYFCPEGSSTQPLYNSSFYCPSGKWSDAGMAGSADDCYKCPAGYRCRTGSKYQCSGGYYCPEGSSSSQTCPEGNYCPAGSGAPIACPAGLTTNGYSKSSSSDCNVECREGYYCDGTGQKYCPAGTWSDIGADSEDDCYACPAGYRCSSGGKSQCPAGRYCPEGSSYDDVSYCPAGTWSDAGADSEDDCYACPAGAYCDGTGYKRACPAGTYGEVGAESIDDCNVCPGGTWNNQTNATSCNDCPAGKYCPEGSLSNGTNCPAGTWSDVGADAEDDCYACPAGYRCNYGYKYECSAGYYCPEGSSSSTSCPVGNYCPAGSAAPIACPAGTTSSGYSQSLSDCAACSAGQYCPGGVASSTCPKGWYCPAGVAPVMCPEGTYNPNTGQSTSSACYTCGYAKWSVEGSTSSDNCTACEAGYYCNNGSKTACPAGYYCPEGSGSGNSYGCPVGKYCPEGSAAPIACPAGLTTNDYHKSSSSDCNVECQEGYYCDGTGRYSCPAGTWSESGSDSADDCTACPAGYYCNYGSKTASSAGKYCPEGSAYWNDCSYCPSGTWSDAGAAGSVSDCYVCPAGYACYGYGNKDECRAGYYCPEGSSSAYAYSCPAGNYCPVGSAAPTACPDGTYNPYSGASSKDSCYACFDGYETNENHTQCVPIEYNISYELNGGNWDNYGGNNHNPSNYSNASYTDINFEPQKPGYAFVGWCDDEELTKNCDTYRSISSGYLNNYGYVNGDITFYAKWELQQTTCPAGQYAFFSGRYSYCHYCESGYYCPGKNSTGGSTLTPNDNGMYACPAFKPNSKEGAKSMDECSMCPEADFSKDSPLDDNFGAVWYDMNGDGMESMDECVLSVYGVSDAMEMEKCAMKLQMTDAELQAELGDNYYTYGFDKPCDYNKANFGLMTCRYSSADESYTDCSEMVAGCSDADLQSIMTVMQQDGDSKDIVDIELDKKGLNTNTIDWDEFFVQNLAGVDSFDDIARYNTCEPEGYKYCEAGKYYNVSESDCVPCTAGSYCVGGLYATDSATDAGIETCSGNTFSGAKATSCIQCPVGVSAANQDHTSCVCTNNDFTYDSEKNICYVDSCSDTDYCCEPGDYLNVDTDKGYAGCESCLPGSYCEGVIIPIENATEDAGITSCQDGYYSIDYGATICTQCPTGSTSNSEHTGCECPDGYEWNSERNTCEFTTCPAVSVASAPYYVLANGYMDFGGMYPKMHFMYDFDNNGDNITDCMTMVVKADDLSMIESDPVSANITGTSFCRYDEATQNYTNCATPLKACNENELDRFMYALNKSGTVAAFRQFTELAGKQSPNDLTFGNAINSLTDANNCLTCPEPTKTFDIAEGSLMLLDLNGDNQASQDECVFLGMSATDIAEAGECMSDADCNWEQAGLKLFACRYNTTTGDYDDCSEALNMCNATDMSVIRDMAETESVSLRMLLALYNIRAKMGLSNTNPDWNNDFFTVDMSSQNTITDGVIGANPHNVCLVCPISPNETITLGNDFVDIGAMESSFVFPYDFANDGESLDDCVKVVAQWDMANSELPTALSVCKYNSATDTYFGSCATPVATCTQEDLWEITDVDGGPAAMLQAFATKSGVQSPSNLVFNQSGDNLDSDVECPIQCPQYADPAGVGGGFLVKGPEYVESLGSCANSYVWYDAGVYKMNVCKYNENTNKYDICGDTVFNASTPAQASALSSANTTTGDMVEYIDDTYTTVVGVDVNSITDIPSRETNSCEPGYEWNSSNYACEFTTCPMTRIIKKCQGDENSWDGGACYDYKGSLIEGITTETECNEDYEWRDNKCFVRGTDKEITSITTKFGCEYEFDNEHIMGMPMLADIDGNKTKTIDECVVFMESIGDPEAETEEEMDIRLSTCRYNTQTGDYTDCSTTLGVCSEADLMEMANGAQTEEEMFVAILRNARTEVGASTWDAFFGRDFTSADYTTLIDGANGVITNAIINQDSFSMCCPAGQYMLNDNGVATCSECPNGSYCTGGVYETSATAGAVQCPAGSVVNNDGTGCDCSGLGAGYHWESSTNTCDSCPMGFYWDASKGTCSAVVCPEGSMSYTNIPQDGSAGLLELTTRMAKSYGDTQDECITLRLYYENGAPLLASEFESMDINDWLAAGASVAFCKYNSTTGNYDGACSKKYSLCEDDSMVEMMTLANTSGPVAVAASVFDIDTPEEFDALLTENAADLANEVAVNRCCPEGFVCCSAGEYIVQEDGGTANQCATCEAGSYCPGVQWEIGTTFNSGKSECPVNTYNSTTGATSADACLACPTDYPLSAIGTGDIAQCYANCQTPTCVDNASGCAYVNPNQTTKTFGNTCGTNITGCNGGYTPTGIAAWAAANWQTHGNFASGCPFSRGGCDVGSTHWCDESDSGCVAVNAGDGLMTFNDAPISNVRYITSCNAFDDTTPAGERNFIPTVSGNQCWMKLTKLGNAEITTSGWVFIESYSSAEACAENCGMFNMAESLQIMQNLIMSLAGINVCAANAVNIAWGGIAEPDNLGMCTYGKNLTTPDTEPTQENRLFLGWKPVLITNNENNLENNENFTGNGE